MRWAQLCCVVVWTFFGIVFLLDWQSCGHCWVFQLCWHIEYSTFTTSSFRIWNSSTGIPSPPLALFIVMLHIRTCISTCIRTPKIYIFSPDVFLELQTSILDCSLAIILFLRHINCEVFGDFSLFYQNFVFPISMTGTINYPVRQVRNMSHLTLLSPWWFTVIPSHCQFYLLNLSHAAYHLSAIGNLDIAIVSDPCNFKPVILL